MSRTLGSADWCCNIVRACSTRCVAGGQPAALADGVADLAAGVGLALGLTLRCGDGLGAAELCETDGVGASGPGAWDGELDVVTGAGVLTAEGLVPPPVVIAPAIATPAMAATAVPSTMSVAPRVLMRDSEERRCRGGRRTGF